MTKESTILLSQTISTLRRVAGLVPLLALALLLLAPATHARRAAQSEPKVSAQLSTGVARPGEQIVMSITCENGRNVRIVEVPTVEGLSIAQPAGPMVSQYSEFSGGRFTQRVETTFRVAIRALDAGRFEIPPFILEVDGKRVRTRATAFKVVKDLAGEELGFFQIKPSATTLVEGQPFTLELRFGWDEATESNYASLSLPWWDALPGAVEIETPTNARNTAEVMVNDEVAVPIERVQPRPGEKGVVYRLQRTFLPTRSGTLEFPSSYLEFGRVERRMFSTQRKLSSYFVPAQAFALEIISLPREGQPIDYSRAVGTFEARAATDTRDVVVGDSIKLTVDWTGDGNLEFFEPPDLSLHDEFRGFQVYGSTEEKSFDRRRVVYDLAPLDDELTAIPPVDLSVFDPSVGEYVTVSTEEIPIRVRPLASAIELDVEGEEQFARDIRDIHTAPLALAGAGGAGSGGDARGDRVLLFAFPSLLVVWFVGRTAVRRRLGDPDAPLERRRRRARGELRRALRRASAPAETLAAFTHFLSARTREGDEAWAGRDALRWCVATGRLKRDDAEGLAKLLGRLERAVYGGGESVAQDEVLAMADRVGRAGL